MLEPLLADFPTTVSPLLELLDSTLPTSPPLSQILASGPTSALTDTENAQPLILLTSVAIVEVMRQQFGFSAPAHARYFLGHSLGEFTALVAAGHISLADALKLVRRRGEIMAACARRAAVPELDGGPGETGMVALVVEASRVPSLIKSVEEFMVSETLPNDEFLSIGNINSSTQIVLSGHTKAIETCLCHLRKFSGHDPRALRLNVTAPFHSSVMTPAVPVIRRILEQIEVRWPTEEGAEVVSNASARPYGSIGEMRKLVADQAVSTVRWAESIQWLDKERDVGRWIGIGPGRVASNLVGKEVRGGMGRVFCVEGVSGKEVEAAVKAIEAAEVE